MGFHFKTAAETLGLAHDILSFERFQSSFKLFNKIAWRLLDKKLWRQNQFEDQLIHQSQIQKSKTILVLGTSPISRKTLEKLKAKDIKIINVLTDDPWSPHHSSKWLFQSLGSYDLIMNPRKSNLDQLKSISNNRVVYMPFGYNPKVHFIESTLTPEQEERYRSDVMFFGGADKDRFPYILELIRKGFSVKLYGGYWDRFPETRPLTLGIVKLSEIRKAVKASKVVLNLVRRSNRDGHVMRTFEAPAMGGCVLNELTEEHLEIIGKDNSLFFQTPEEMAQQAKLLIQSKDLSSKFTQLNRDRILMGKNTYADRLKTILEYLSSL